MLCRARATERTRLGSHDCALNAWARTAALYASGRVTEALACARKVRAMLDGTSIELALAAQANCDMLERALPLDGQTRVVDGTATAGAVSGASVQPIDEFSGVFVRELAMLDRYNSACALWAQGAPSADVLSRAEAALRIFAPVEPCAGEALDQLHAQLGEVESWCLCRVRLAALVVRALCIVSLIQPSGAVDARQLSDCAATLASRAFRTSCAETKDLSVLADLCMLASGRRESVWLMHGGASGEACGEAFVLWLRARSLDSLAERMHALHQARMHLGGQAHALLQACVCNDLACGAAASGKRALALHWLACAVESLAHGPPSQHAWHLAALIALNNAVCQAQDGQAGAEALVMVDELLRAAADGASTAADDDSGERVLLQVCALLLQTRMHCRARAFSAACDSLCRCLALEAQLAPDARRHRRLPTRQALLCDRELLLLLGGARPDGDAGAMEGLPASAERHSALAFAAFQRGGYAVAVRELESALRALRLDSGEGDGEGDGAPPPLPPTLKRPCVSAAGDSRPASAPRLKRRCRALWLELASNRALALRCSGLRDEASAAWLGLGAALRDSLVCSYNASLDALSRGACAEAWQLWLAARRTDYDHVACVFTNDDALDADMLRLQRILLARRRET